MKKILENKFIKKYPTLCASIFYTVIAIIFTFPLILRMNTDIPKGGGDVYQSIASIDAQVATVKSLSFEKGSIFLVKSLDTFTPYVLLNLLVNKILAYNILFLLTFILSGIGMYLLAFYITKNRTASLLAGLIYAFSPFHYYQSVAVHLGTMQQQWLPFFVLFLIRFFEKLEAKYFVGTAFFALLIASAEHQLLAFTILFAVAFLGWRIWFDRSILRSKKFWSYVATSALLLTVVIFTLFGQLLKVATSSDNFLDQGMGAADRYSMSFFEPFATPSFHALWPGMNSFVGKILPGADNSRGSYFIGYSVLFVLFFLGRFVYRQRKNKTQAIKNKKELGIAFWTYITGIFYVLSLGPTVSLGKFTLYLPYVLIYKFLPFYENIRTTGRLFVFAMLGVSVLFAFGFIELEKKYNQKRIILPFIFTFLILLEFWVAPMQTMIVAHSAFYDQLGKDQGQYNLIEIPGSTSYEFASYEMFLSTVHKKTVLNGMPLARKISGQFAMQESTPIIKQLLYTVPKGNDPDKKNATDIIDPFDYAQANDLLNFYNVRYITISKQYANAAVQKLAQNFIKAHIQTSNRYEDNFLVAYEVAQSQPKGFFDILDNSKKQFSNTFTDQTDGKLYRVVGNGAALKIVNMSGQAENVKILVDAKSSNAQLNMSLASKQTKSVDMNLTSELKEFVFQTTILPGENIVTFNVTDQAGKSVQMISSKSKRQGALISHISVLAE